MVGGVQIVSAASRVSRSPRRPSHQFQLRTPPFGIQPFLLAPVLPGETLKNALLQVRAVTDPIKHPLIGWWKDYMLFYVKLRDLADREAFTQMILDPDYSVASLLSPSSVVTYNATTAAINYTKLCLDRVVAEFFRDEGELAGSFMIDTNWYAAQVNNTSALHSAVTNAEYELPPDPGVTIGADDVIKMSEITNAMQLWEMQRSAGMTTQTFEQYLRTYGVSVPQEEEVNRPELIRFIREWQYPSNTIDPATGAPSSAVSWSVAERVDKDRFFKEPGFIFGVTVTRPKVYMSKQTSAIAHHMIDAKSWLPAALLQDPYAAYRQFGTTGGPLTGQTTGYWIDLKDLFHHGDQFCNFDPATGDNSAVALPTASLQKKYPTTADVTGLFKTGTAYQVREDGICTLNILSPLARDRTLQT